MKYIKKANTFLLAFLLTTGHYEKNIEKTLFVSAGVQKKLKNRGFWEYGTAISIE